MDLVFDPLEELLKFKNKERSAIELQRYKRQQVSALYSTLSKQLKSLGIYEVGTKLDVILSATATIRHLKLQRQQLQNRQNNGNMQLDFYNV